MDENQGGQSSYNSSYERQRQAAAELARQKVLAAYSSTVNSLPKTNNPRETLIQNAANQVSHEYARTQVNEHLRGSVSPNTNPHRFPDTSAYQTSANSVTNQRPTVYSSVPERPKKSLPNIKEFLKQKSAERAKRRAAKTHDLQNSQTAPIDNVAQSSNNTPSYSNTPSAMKDLSVNQANISAEWQKYHSAWQDYYKKYYSEYYAKAAQNYLETEKMKTERIASGKVARARNLRRLMPVGILLLFIATGLFLQYNRLVFAPIMAYISPNSDNVTSSITAVDPTVSGTISPEPRLIIPKLNVDVPVAFGISTADVDQAMAEGVAQFMIPGANAMPGQIGNLVITGHSAGDIYSSNPYKFIFSGLERLEVGDLIYINYESTRYTYQMTGREVVEPTNVDALIYDTNKPMLTLITCTPLGTSRYRLLISAEQISPEPNPDNIAIDSVDDSATTDMPANEPSFFETIWENIFGN